MNELALNQEPGQLEALVPTDWRPAVAWFLCELGPVASQISSTLMLRLNRYSRSGYTLDDITTAFNGMGQPSTQARCRYPGDWLNELAAAVDAAKRDRQAAERRKAQAKHAVEERRAAEERRQFVGKPIEELAERGDLFPWLAARFADQTFIPAEDHRPGYLPRVIELENENGDES